jgi:hypothetical protein
LGAHEMPRSDFLTIVREAKKDIRATWTFEPEYWERLMMRKAQP